MFGERRASRWTAAVLSTALLAVPMCAWPSALVAEISPSVPSVTTGPAPRPEAGEAVITGVINPRGQKVRFWIAFGPERPSENHSELSEELVIGTQPQEVEERIGGLSEGTVYHYRLVAVYAHKQKMVFGRERAFRTDCLVEDPRGKIVERACRR